MNRVPLMDMAVFCQTNLESGPSSPELSILPTISDGLGLIPKDDPETCHHNVDPTREMASPI